MFDVYGRMRLEVVREGDRWIAYKLEPGKRLKRPDLIIPPTLATPAEIATYLDDLFHEVAGPGDRVREITNAC